MIFLDTSSAIQILNGNNSLESLIEKFEILITSENMVFTSRSEKFIIIKEDLGR
jgi:hypothetical protein